MAHTPAHYVNHAYAQPYGKHCCVSHGEIPHGEILPGQNSLRFIMWKGDAPFLPYLIASHLALSGSMNWLYLALSNYSTIPN
jgi:hypothetical protein